QVRLMAERVDAEDDEVEVPRPGQRPDSYRLVGEVDAYLAQPPRAVGRQAFVELQPVLDGDIEEVADAELPAIRRLEDASARGVGLHLQHRVWVHAQDEAVEFKLEGDELRGLP